MNSLLGNSVGMADEASGTKLCRERKARSRPARWSAGALERWARWGFEAIALHCALPSSFSQTSVGLGGPEPNHGPRDGGGAATRPPGIFQGWSAIPARTPGPSGHNISATATWPGVVSHPVSQSVSLLLLLRPTFSTYPASSHSHTMTGVAAFSHAPPTCLAPFVGISYPRHQTDCRQNLKNSVLFLSGQSFGWLAHNLSSLDWAGPSSDLFGILAIHESLAVMIFQFSIRIAVCLRQCV